MKKKVVFIVSLLTVFVFVNCSMITRLKPSVPIVFSNENAATARNIDSSRSIDSTGAYLAFTFKSGQSGVLVTGHSSVPDAGMEFKVSKTGRDGVEYGGYIPNLLSWDENKEKFITPNPSIPDDYPDGTELFGVVGTLLIELGAGKQTQINLHHYLPDLAIRRDSIHAQLTELNEVVIRLDGELSDSADGFQGLEPEGIYIQHSPHFIGVSNGILQKFGGGDLIINGDADVANKLDNVGHILLLPASIVGADFSYLTPAGINIVANPAIDDDSPVSEMVKRNDWIQDIEGNFGLFAMMDEIVGIQPSDRAESQEWLSLAEYFQNFFLKFYQMGSIMFGDYLNVRTQGFLIFALDDINGPLVIGEDQGVWITYDPGDSEFLIENGKLNINGEHALRFKAVVTTARLYEVKYQ